MYTRNYYVYIMASKSGTLYIGVTNNLEKRVWEHKNEIFKGFSKKYECKKLVYYEDYNEIHIAITREKQLKNWHRKWKINLIEPSNKDWKDLSIELGIKN